MATGRFRICCGSAANFLNRVCLDDEMEERLKVVWSRRGSDIHSLNRPLHFAADGDGHIFVADWGNRRVLLINSDLDFQTEPATRKAGVNHPGRICLNNSTLIIPTQVTELETFESIKRPDIAWTLTIQLPSAFGIDFKMCFQRRIHGAKPLSSNIHVAFLNDAIMQL